MAASEHLLRFRLYTAEELAAERTRLITLNSGFSSQNMGTKAYQIATRDVLDQLNAIAYVQRERGYSVPDGPRATPNTMVGTVDFSQLS